MKIYMALSVLVGMDVALSVAFPLTYHGASVRAMRALESLDHRMAAKLAVQDPDIRGLMNSVKKESN